MCAPTRPGLTLLTASLLLLGGSPHTAPLAGADQHVGAACWETAPVGQGGEVAEHATTVKAAAARIPSRDLWSNEGLRPLKSSAATCAGCESGCGGGCQYMPAVWAQFDALLWWSQGQGSPPLVTTSPDNTLREDAGVLGRPGTQILHGGERLDGNGRLGGRFNVGMWLDDCRHTAIEATWLMLGDGGNSGNFYAQSVQDPVSPILARPFFNTQLEEQDARLVAFPDIVTGDVQVETSNELNSVSVLARWNYCRGAGCRVNLVGGYRFLRFREGLLVNEQLTSIDDGGVVPVGTVFQLFDSFATDNEFHGGEIGLSLFYDHGPWSLDVLPKLAIGNMRQTVAIDGSTMTISPIDPPLTQPGGLLALPTNIGQSEQDRVALIPELNLNLRYHWSACFSMSVGYSLLWITDVARAGDQIDFRVNPSQLPSNGGSVVGDAYPRRQLDHSSMWFQGLNLGVAWQY